MKHLLTDIHIQDFKCFKDFKAEGFKRVNLIGGKNNVGKTAFMEACYVNLESNPSLALMEIIEGRYISNFFSKLVKEVGINYIYRLVKEKAILYNKAIILSNLKKTEINYTEEDIHQKRNGNILYMDSYRTSSTSLEQLYSKILEKKLENKVDNELKLFDSDIDSFRIINSEPKCSLVVDNKFYNLNEFGDGLYRYITYLCIFNSIERNSIIFIDEIDNGIHYTNLDKLWELILTISKEQNVQVFATTHSKECIESYARVSKKFEDEEITFIELGRNKKNELDSIVMNNEMFQRFIKMGNEVRGW